jgi:hypothetical protein
MNAAKKKAFENQLKIVGTYRDKLGMKVDVGIRKTVALFNLLGFKTTMSCAGHTAPDHGTLYPWVDIEIKGSKSKEKELRTLVRSYWDHIKNEPSISNLFSIYIYDDFLPESVRIQSCIEISSIWNKKKIPAAVRTWINKGGVTEMKRFTEYLEGRYDGTIKGIKNPPKGRYSV